MDGLLRSLDALRQPLLLLDMGARGWPILHANEAWTKSMGVSFSHVATTCLLVLLYLSSQTAESQRLVKLPKGSWCKSFAHWWLKMQMHRTEQFCQSGLCRLQFEPQSVKAMGCASMLPLPLCR